MSWPTIAIWALVLVCLAVSVLGGVWVGMVYLFLQIGAMLTVAYSFL